MAEVVFAFLAFTSGSYEGAIIRDMRLANALRRRGFKVFVYWMMESNRDLVDAGIVQRTLCNGMRYQFARPAAVMDRLGRLVSALVPGARRRRFMQQHPDYVNRLMSNCCRAICDGDPGLSARLEKFLARDGVTHLLPTFAMICPFAEPAKKNLRAGGREEFDYLVTFQGEEIFANFAERIGRLDDYHRRLRQTVAGSGWPAIAVSADYSRRLADEMGIDPARLRPVYPGIDPPAANADRPDPPRAGGESARPSELSPSPASADFSTLKTIFKSLRPDLPIVTYLGRQDAEKGIDLLLYAVKILRQRGVQLQLLCVGGSSFGMHYREACEQIAQHLRLPVFWKRRVNDAVRAALYRRSRCVVYPSIHREPFGMVAAEAMIQGTPVLVPDIGGITEVIHHAGLTGGLTFKSWDSGDLATQLERLVTDDALHARLTADTRAVAENFTVERMTDRVLAHLGLPRGRPE